LGTQRETLLEQKITLTQFRKANEWLAKVDALKRAEGLTDDDGAQATLEPGTVPRRKRFDKIEVKVDDGVLRVEGVRRVSELAPGLGGSFTYCTLARAPKSAPPHYLGETLDKHVWLIYEPQLAFLKSPAAALTLSQAEALAAWGREHDKKRGQATKGHLVFAPAKYLSNRQLKDHGVDFAPLPFALYREA
jgi:adenine-specific DNA-methyltransferase